MTLIVRTVGGKVLYHNSPDGGWAWVVLVSAFFLQWMGIAWIRSLGLFYNDFMESYDATNSQTSLITSMAAAMMGLAAPIAGILMRKFGGRKVLLTSGVLCCLGLLLTGFGSGIWTAYLGVGIIWGIGFSWSYSSIMAQINIYFCRWRGIANGIAATGSSVGSMLIPILAQYLIYTYGWRGALIVFAGIELNICVFASLVRPISTVTAKQMPKYKNLQYADKATNLDEIQAMTVSLEVLDYIQQAEEQNVVDVNKSKAARVLKLLNDYWLLMLLACAEFGIGLCGYHPIIFMVPFAKDLGCTNEQAVLLLFMTAIGDAICRPLSGFLLSCYQNMETKILFIMGFIFLAKAGICAMVLFATGFESLSIFAICYGCLFGMFVTTNATAIPALFGIENVVKFIGPILLTGGVAAAISAPLAGHLVDIYETYKAAYFYSMGCSILTSFLLLISGICVQKLGAVLPEHRSQRAK
ncbi:monocarboxylate transporter 2-like [Styela clava]